MFSRKLSLLIFTCLYLSLVPSCRTDDAYQIEANSASSTFDEMLAKELQADDYGMSSYVLAFLKKGPNRPTNPQEGADLQTAHLANIQRLTTEGKLLLAGPFLDEGEIRGIYIFDVATVEEARELTSTDPAIIAGSLVMELQPWYGSATLKKLNDLHKKVMKKAF